MAKPFMKSDIRITRFRLPNEDLRDGGSGCLIYHIPTKQSYVSELAAPFHENKQKAIGDLCSALSITREAFDQQATTKVFPDWKTVEMFQRLYTLDGAPVFVLTVFYFDGEEDDPEVSGWTWSVESDGRTPEHDPGLYETPEGAVHAAEKWALAVYTQLNKEESADDTEGESPSPDESPK